MRKVFSLFVTTLIFPTLGLTADVPAQASTPPATPAVETSTAPQQGAAQPTEVETNSPVAPYKINYFAMNNWPWNSASQAKFQFSMKFRVLKPDLYIFASNYFPAYVAYTQKSMWNIGQPSSPFEETNYNPEFFLDYPVNKTIMGRVHLRNVVVGILEHESNGLAGPQSRSWNRQYVLVRFGLKAKEKLDITNSFLADKASLYIKLWLPSGYTEQDDYLKAVGNNNKFLDYMGRGELGLSIRNFLWRGAMKDHQLDIKLPLFHDTDKPSCQLEFRQQLPNMNFSIYLQYWYGYGETLLRFDQFGHRGFAGLSFSY